MEDILSPLNLLNPESALLLMQIVNLMLLIAIIALILMAFKRMSVCRAGSFTMLLWSLLIIFVPIFGPLAFLFTHPSARDMANS